MCQHSYYTYDYIKTKIKFTKPTVRVGPCDFSHARKSHKNTAIIPSSGYIMKCIPLVDQIWWFIWKIDHNKIGYCVCNAKVIKENLLYNKLLLLEHVLHKNMLNLVLFSTSLAKNTLQAMLRSKSYSSLQTIVPVPQNNNPVKTNFWLSDFIFWLEKFRITWWRSFFMLNLLSWDRQNYYLPLFIKVSS